MQCSTTERWWKRACAALAATLVMIVLDARAEAWLIEPYAKVTTEHDSNARLSTDDEEDVTAVNAIGALKLLRRSEISDVEAEIRVDAVNYSGADFDDRLNRVLGIDWTHKGERFDAGVAADYEVDTVLRTVDTIVQPDDIEIDPDGDVDVALVTVDVERSKLRLRPFYAYDWNERNRLGASLSYRAVTYDEEVPGLSEYTDQTVSGYWAYRVSELDRLTTTLSVGRYEADDVDRRYDNRELRAALTHAFDETMDGGIEAGFHQTEWDDGEDGDEDGYLLRLFGSKRTGLTRFSGRVGRSIFPSSAGDLVKADELLVRMTRELSPRTRFWVSARMYQNESLREENLDANRRYLSIQPTISWNITPAWALEGSYRYRRQKRDTDDDSAESNMVYVGLRYAFPVALDD